MNVECAQKRYFVEVVLLIASCACLLSFVWVSTVRAAGRAAAGATRRSARLKIQPKPHLTATPVLVELFTAEGQPHGFFHKSPWKERTLQRADEFLVTLGYLQGKATIAIPNHRIACAR